MSVLHFYISPPVSAPMSSRFVHRLRLGAAALALLGGLAHAAGRQPVLLGIDGEFGLDNSTSAQAVELGMRAAIECRAQQRVLVLLHQRHHAAEIRQRDQAVVVDGLQGRIGGAQVDQPGDADDDGNRAQQCGQEDKAGFDAEVLEHGKSGENGKEKGCEGNWQDLARRKRPRHLLMLPVFMLQETSCCDHVTFSVHQ